MQRENSNSTIRLLILIRPGDSLRPTLLTFLQHTEYEYSICFSIYEVLEHLCISTGHRLTFLVCRPGMLTAEAGTYLGNAFTDLRIVGWLDRDEKMSDCCLGDNAAVLMTLISSLSQLKKIIETYSVTIISQPAESVGSTTSLEDQNARLQCTITDDEIGALLGANP